MLYNKNKKPSQESKKSVFMSLDTQTHTLKMNGNCQFQDDCVFFDKISLSNDWFDMSKTWKSSLVLTFGGIVATKKILNIIWFFFFPCSLRSSHIYNTLSTAGHNSFFTSQLHYWKINQKPYIIISYNLCKLKYQVW